MRQVKESELQIPKVRFAEPKHNLPGRKGIATAEDRFTLAFSRAYAIQAGRIHHGSTRNFMRLAREIPANGYGIADLCVVAWNDDATKSLPDGEQHGLESKQTVLAFECKLTDWRKAMTQGSRYRFFANQAIVVLPNAVCDLALPFLETFKKIYVGLWGFETDSRRITAYFTPRSRKPKSFKHYSHAVRTVARTAKQALPIA